MARGEDPRASNRAIAHGVLWVAIFVMLAKLVGAAKEVVIAARYGVGPVVDAYGLLFMAMSLPAGMCLSLLIAVVVPVEAKLRHDGSSERGRFRSELLGMALLGGVLVACGHAWAMRLMSGVAAESVSGPLHDMVPGMAVAGGLAIVVSLYSAWILSGGRHVNSALEGVMALVLLLVLLGAPVASAGWLVAGTLAGVVVHMLLAVALQTRDGGLVVPRWTLSSGAWRLAGAAFGLTIVSQALTSVTPMLELLIASRLGEGAVSVLGYANRLLALFSGLASVVVTRALMPVLSHAHLQSPALTRALVAAWTRRSVVAGLLLGLLVALAAEPLTRLLFERGQFAAADTARVAGVLRFASTQLPVLLPSLVLAAYAMAMRRYRLMLWTGVSTVVCVPLAGWLFSAWLGLQGLVLAPTLSLCIATALLVAGLRQDVERRP